MIRKLSQRGDIFEQATHYIRSGGDAPDQLRCPLTLSVYVRPVVTTCGTTYSRAAITKWLAVSDTDPCTHLTLRGPHRFVSNRDMALHVDAFWHEVAQLHAANPRAQHAARVIQRAWHRRAPAAVEYARQTTRRAQSNANSSPDWPAIFEDAKRIALAFAGVALYYRAALGICRLGEDHGLAFMYAAPGALCLGPASWYWLQQRGMQPADARHAWMLAERVAIDLFGVASMVRALHVSFALPAAQCARVAQMLAIFGGLLRPLYISGRLTNQTTLRSTVTMGVWAVVTGAALTRQSTMLRAWAVAAPAVTLAHLGYVWPTLVALVAGGTFAAMAVDKGFVA